MPHLRVSQGVMEHMVRQHTAVIVDSVKCHLDTCYVTRTVECCPKGLDESEKDVATEVSIQVHLWVDFFVVGGQTNTSPAAPQQRAGCQAYKQIVKYWSHYVIR